MAVDRTVAPEIRPFAKMVIPEQNIEVLANGMTLHTYSGGDQPVCSVNMLIPYSAESLPSQAVPKLLPSMILAGSRSMSADEIDDCLDFCGVRATGHASHNYIQLGANLLTKHSCEIFGLLAEAYSSPSFDSTRLESAKSKLTAKILTTRSKPITLATEELNKLYYGADNFMARVLLPEDVMPVTVQTLKDFHGRIFNPQKIHLFLSGLLDEDIIENARKAFGAINVEAPGEDVSNEKASPVPTPCRATVAAPESFQSAITIGIPSIGRLNPDYIPLRYTVMVLGGYFGSRLMSNIREEKGLTYHISAALLGVSSGSHAQISALCDKSFTDTVIDEIKVELRRLAAEPPVGDELDRLKLHAMTELAETLDNPSNIMGYYVAQQTVGTPADYFEAQQRELKALTSEKISEMASRYLSPEKMITVTTT